MTISTSSSSIVIGGNGSATAFEFPFIADQASDIVVEYTDSSGNITTLNSSQYTLVINTPAVNQLWGIGGVVTYPISGSPIAAGTSLTISRVLPYTQEISIQNQGNFYPQVTEQALDILEMQIQQNAGTLGRAIQIPIVDPLSINTILPAAAARANQALLFDGSGNVIVGQIAGGGTIVSAAMQPVVEASTLALARTAFGLGAASDVVFGGLDNTIIGANTPAAGAFTNLNAIGTVTFSPNNANVTIAPTGNGAVVIGPTLLGNINNMTIGNSTPAAAAFTTITVTGATAPTNGFYLPAANTVGISAGGVEIMQFTSGTALIGFTSGIVGVTAWLEMTATGGVKNAMAIGATSATTATAIGFYNSGNGVVGSISFSTTATAFNTSSDKRIKTNVATYSDSGTIIDGLSIKTFNWLTDPGAPQSIGILAQDAYAVYADPITVGDSNTGLVPGNAGYQGWSVDYSKYVPIIIAELQSIRSRLTAGHL